MYGCEPAVQRALITNASAEQLDEEALHDAALMDKMDAYIGIRASNNSSDVRCTAIPNGALHYKIQR